MELNKLSFPVKITLEEAISIFQKEFDKKGYKVKITKDNMRLNEITSDRFAAMTGNILKDEGLQKQISGKYDLVVAIL